MTQQYIKWKQSELDFLKINYDKLSTKKLSKFLHGRSITSIRCKASRIGAGPGIKRKSNLEVLLQDTPEAYYWIGFLMADASFTERRIILGVAEKDLGHLNKFMNFTKCKNSIYKLKHENHFRIKPTCVNVVKSLRKKFKIQNNKTKHPCDISSINNKNLLFSLIIGYIDGDGCVSKNKKCKSFILNLVGDKSWFKNFKYIEKFLYDFSDEPFIKHQCKVRDHFTHLPQDKNKKKRKFKICNFNMARKSLLIKIKQKAEELKLPFMERKIGKIVY